MHVESVQTCPCLLSTDFVRHKWKEWSTYQQVPTVVGVVDYKSICLERGQDMLQHSSNISYVHRC